MEYHWSWFGLANLIASVLLFAIAFLFLRARRSEFTIAFAAFSVTGAFSKFAGGMWLYFSADQATASFWHFVVTLFWIPFLPLLAHALCAFTWEKRFGKLHLGLKIAIYLPFAALLPLAYLDPPQFAALAFPFGLAYILLLLPFPFLVVRKYRRSISPIERTQCRYMFVWLVIVLSFTLESRLLPVLGMPFPHWELAIAYGVATSILVYGILKTHLFDIDTKIKWTIQKGTVAGVFLGVFLVVTQLAQNYLSDEYGWMIGGVATGLVLFGLSPVQRFAERFANTMMPGVRSLADMGHPERSGLYREQALVAWSDGNLTPSERQLLDILRSRLGLSLDESTAIEREITTNLLSKTSPKGT